MISRMSEAPLPIRRKRRVSAAAFPLVAGESAVEAGCISPSQDVTNRQCSSPNFNRPRVRFISPPVSRFFFLSLRYFRAACLYLLPLFLNSKPRLSRFGFSPVCLTAASVTFHRSFFFLSLRNGVCLRRLDS